MRGEVSPGSREDRLSPSAALAVKMKILSHNEPGAETKSTSASCLGYESLTWPSADDPALHELWALLFLWRFPESRRKVYDLTSIHEHLPPQAWKDMEGSGMEEGLE